MAGLLWGACPTPTSPVTTPCLSSHVFRMNPALLTSAGSESSPRHQELCSKRDAGFPRTGSCKTETRTAWVVTFCHVETDNRRDRQTDREIRCPERKRQGECNTWFLGIGTHFPVPSRDLDAFLPSRIKR